MCSFFKITIAMLGCVLVLAGCTHDDEVEIAHDKPRVNDPSPEQMRDAQAIIRVVNEFRTENGLPPLILEAHLMHAALVKAKDFRKNWRFYHAGSDGSTPDQRVSRAGYLWVAVGETLAAAQATARGAVGNLKASPCHRYALLRPIYIHGGAAYIYTPDAPVGRYKHWWVIKLARPSAAMIWDKTYPTAGAEKIERSGEPTRMPLPRGCIIRGGS